MSGGKFDFIDFVNALQALAGHASLGEMQLVFTKSARLQEPPDILPAGTRLLIRHLLFSVLLRLRAIAGASDDGIATSGAITITEFKAAVARLVEAGSEPLPHVVRVFQRVLTERFQDPLLNERTVAKAVGISPSHLTRTLTRHTGHGFRWHLRRARIEASVDLLLTTTLSMKEIAAAVGFSSPGEFDRQFRVIRGCTPTSFRDHPSVIVQPSEWRQKIG